MRIPGVFLILACNALIILPASAQFKPAATLIPNPAQQASQDTLQASLSQNYPDVYSLYQLGKMEQAITLMNSYLPQHENDTEYFNLLGSLYLGQRAYTLAAAAFERVVLMQPENAGAWMDLAVSLTESGNDATALSYFSYIEDTFAPPPALMELIARYRAKIRMHENLPSKWRHLVEMQAGVDTNANSGLQSSAIPITLGQERIDLLLDPSFKARRDNFAQLSVNSRYHGVFSQQEFDFSFGARQRSYRTEHAFSNLDLSTALAVQRPTAYGDAGFSLQEEYFMLGSKGLLYNTRASASLERPYRDCRVGVSMEAEWRRYVSLSTLDANVLWIQTGLACDSSVLQRPVQLTAVVRYGFDNPGGNRAGGATRRLELISQLGMLLTKGIRADLSLTLSHAQDDDGYSVLLEQNANRRLDRSNLRLQFTIPVDKTSDVTLAAEDNRITSNLALFQQSGKTLSLGLQKRF